MSAVEELKAAGTGKIAMWQVAQSHAEELDRLRAIVSNAEWAKECAATPLMRDVMAERDELRAKVERLTAINRIQSEFLSSRQCADHNGKWERGRCLQCEIERLRQERDDATGALVSMQARIDAAKAAIEDCEKSLEAEHDAHMRCHRLQEEAEAALAEARRDAL